MKKKDNYINHLKTESPNISRNSYDFSYNENII